MEPPETTSAPPPPFMLPATSESQAQTPDQHSSSPPGTTIVAQILGASFTALRAPRVEQKNHSPASSTVSSSNLFAGFDDISRHVAGSEFDRASRRGSSETRTAPVGTALNTQEKKAAVAAQAPSTPRVAEAAAPPSVHFPDTLPVPIHEHHHHHHHHHHQTHNVHHSHHHHHRPYHPNTPASPSPQAANPMDEGVDITTPLPSYPSSARISRCSSMRSLIISLESPSLSGSVCDDYSNNHPHQGLYDREGNTSGNFGYRLGRRLDTLVSASSTEEEAPTSDLGEGTECIHSLRKGTPMKLPLPTLDSEDRRGRSLVVRPVTGSSLRNEMVLRSSNEGENISSRSQESPSAILNRIVELQLHRTYEELRRLSEALEACSVSKTQIPTPGGLQLETSPMLPVVDGAKNCETINLSQDPSTGESTPLGATTSVFPVLHQLGFQRASADPQDLRQLAELNMRLLRNLQVSLRKLDKLRTLVREQGARGVGGGNGTDPEDDDRESDNEVFVPREREGARKQTHRERSESQGREAEEKEARRTVSTPTRESMEKARGKKSGTIMAVTRALGLAKPRPQDPATNSATANTAPDNIAPSAPTGSIAPIPAYNTLHPVSTPFSPVSPQGHTFSWSSLWLRKRQSIVETLPSALNSGELSFNGMHGSCCTCGDKHKQKETMHEKAWGVSGFWKKGMGRPKKGGVEVVPMENGGAFWN